MIIEVRTQDGDHLGFIKTDAEIDLINDIIGDSFKREMQNYDIRELIKDIESEGYGAERYFIDSVEL